MREIEFSTMFDTTDFPGMGGAFFDAFTARNQLKVNPRHMEWGDAWNQLVQFGLSLRGPDVSEVGTTWLGSFATMEALRPVAPAEMALFGNEQDYPPAIWNSCQMHQNNLMLAVPLVLDLRVVLYRRDWLQKAGVDESTAFLDSDHFRQTLQQLKAAGHPSPLGLTTSQSHTIVIHDMASWVWSAGGDLRSTDGRRMMLMDPKSRAGMNAYFGLHEFISPEMRGLSESQVHTDFFAGKTAVAILKENVYLGYEMQRSNSEVTENVGLAMLMQAPYLGASALVIWRHSMDYSASLKLIQYLTSLEAWQVLDQIDWPYTPAHLGVLEQSHLAATPFYPAIQKSLKNGRSCHSGHRWNGVEARLAETIEQLWSDLHVQPELNIAREVEKRFSDLCNRLEQTILATSW